LFNPDRKQKRRHSYQANLLAVIDSVLEKAKQFSIEKFETS